MAQPLFDKKYSDRLHTYGSVMWDFIKDKLGNDIGVVVELGSYEGHWASGLLNNINIGKLFSIDIWPKERDFVQFCGRWFENVGDHAFENAFPLRGETLEWVHVLPQKEFVDLLFVDACHKRNAVIEDLTAWYPRVYDGGLILMHDAVRGKRKDGVYNAVNIFFRDKKEKPRIAKLGPRVGFPSFWIIKGDAN